MYPNITTLGFEQSKFFSCQQKHEKSVTVFYSENVFNIRRFDWVHTSNNKCARFLYFLLREQLETRFSIVFLNSGFSLKTSSTCTKNRSVRFWFIQITQHTSAPWNVAHMWVLTDITIIKNKFINSGWSVRWVMAGIYGWVLRREKEKWTCNYRVRLMGAHQKLISYDENNFQISYEPVPYGRSITLTRRRITAISLVFRKLCVPFNW